MNIQNKYFFAISSVVDHSLIAFRLDEDWEIETKIRMVKVLLQALIAKAYKIKDAVSVWGQSLILAISDAIRYSN